VRVRILVGDPDSAEVAARGELEGIGEALASKIRKCDRAVPPCWPPLSVQMVAPLMVLMVGVWEGPAGGVLGGAWSVGWRSGRQGGGGGLVIRW
jgi:hypothetical protein